MKCDFCGDIDPRKVYPVKRGAAWQACVACAVLIDAGHKHKLAARMVARLMPQTRRTPASQVTDADEDNFMALVEAMADHTRDLFWVERMGPGEFL